MGTLTYSITLKLFAAILFLVIVVSSCTVNPETLPEPRKIITPKVGSTFTYVTTQIDTLGYKVAGSLEDTTVYTVVQANITHKGKSEVRMLVSNKMDTLYQFSDSSNYFEYETTRDSIWVQYPILTQSKTSLSFRDITLPNRIRYKITDTLERSGETFINLKGESYTGAKILRTFWQRSYRDSVLEQTTSYKSDLAFAYRICAFSEINVYITYTTKAAVTKRGFRYNLIDFKLAD